MSLATTWTKTAVFTVPWSSGKLPWWYELSIANTMDPQELFAVKQCQAGQLEAFTLIYDSYAERVYKFLYFKTFHRESAEDLTSQTFIKALEHVKSFDPERGQIVSWLYRIAQNTFIDHYRRERPTNDIDEVWGLASHEDVAEVVANREALGKVEQYLALLSPEERELILMRVWQGLSYQEIAEVTGRSEASLKMASSRALKKLRESIPLAAYLLLFNLFHL